MKIIADLHIHSRYSRAVSQQMGILEIAHWAKKKGIDLVATGDWTHPLWLREIKANLEEDGTGLLRLKGAEVGTNFFSSANRSAMNLGGKHVSLRRSLKADSEKIVPSPRFLLSTEISSIYTQGGKHRRIHNLVFAPSLSTVEKINQELENKGGNLFSDGRPIISLPSSELVDLVLGVDKDCLIIPAHIWTPWYSLFGSMSGFDSIRECFGKMEKHIFGIETGLSSDPGMNWRINELDNRSILSFSDAHSGPKLGREATVFKIKKFASQSSFGAEKFKMKNDNVKLKISYNDIVRAIKDDKNCDWEIAYTIEFYPEEGKYHYTGHRSCGVRQAPSETKRLGKICPVCGKPLTVGVMHRVEALATREIKKEKLKMKNDENGVRWIGYKNRPQYLTLVPLLEILGESFGSDITSLKVQTEYENLTVKLGGEFGVLLRTPTDEIVKISGKKVAEGIKKVRSGNIVVEPGYDGVFGKVKIWGGEGKEGKEVEKKQLSLF